MVSHWRGKMKITWRQLCDFNCYLVVMRQSCNWQSLTVRTHTHPRLPSFNAYSAGPCLLSFLSLSILFAARGVASYFFTALVAFLSLKLRFGVFLLSTRKFLRDASGSVTSQPEARRSPRHGLQPSILSSPSFIVQFRLSFKFRRFLSTMDSLSLDRNSTFATMSQIHSAPTLVGLFGMERLVVDLAN
ncbi:hypothetical protein EDB89DRAFT_989951 [Lactarius sanguifluus]|nr:hypothetical protein EDB89DRAFT_989951 [Lactarius sanguifluus]